MNELKKELSKLTGINMFNPKYKDVFKKYFPEDKDAEEEKLEEIGIEENPVEEVKPEEKVEDIAEEPEEEKEIEAKQEDIDKAEDEREIDKIEEEKAETPEVKDDKEEAKDEETEEIGKEVDQLEEEKEEVETPEANEVEDLENKLLDKSLELELVKANIRPEKVNSALIIIKDQVKNLDDISKVKDILKNYPEWTVRKEGKAFGMNVDEYGDGLTAEEKRLKDMGINPRD